MKLLLAAALFLTTSHAAAFDFNAPPGPQFSEEEKAAQRERGQSVLPLVQKAFAAGAASVTIPPGDYRFGTNRWQGARVLYPLEFSNLQRDAARPFTIEASSATFWFDLGDEQLPPGHHCVGFVNCRNVIFNGATLDRGTRGHIEGRITRIDRANNRFEIAVSPGIVVPTKFNGAHEQRLMPFKSDGRFCAPLYALQPGGVNLRYTGVTPSENGRYWVTMLNNALMERIHDAAWLRAYGELGTLQAGDGLSLVYSTTQAISLVESERVTMQNLRVFIAKGGGSESGGEGGHLWKDCYFGPRPGTSQWQGGDGYMFNATRHGTTLDNVTIIHSTDDAANFHGYWGNVTKTDGAKITFEADGSLRLALNNARPGDRLRFIDKKTGVALGEVPLVARDGFTVTIDRDAAPFANARAELLDHECAGWTVKNCRWEDNLQRFLILSGPGTIKNCTFTRLGSGIELNTAMPRVGGVPSGIVIEGNTFTDVNTRPEGAAISARAHTLGREGAPPIENLVIKNNIFIRSGGAALTLNGIKGAQIIGNRFEAPLRATFIAQPNSIIPRQPIVLRGSSGVQLQNNTLLDPENHAQIHAATGSPLLGLDNCRDIVFEGRPLPDAPKATKP